jgi:hypothetical protein
MTNAVQLNITIDHNVIFAWAQRRGARPSTFEGDERAWPILFSLGPAATGIEEISWERFFAEFEQAALAFVYRDAGPRGELDDLHQFVARAAVVELVVSGYTTIVEQVT